MSDNSADRLTKQANEFVHSIWSDRDLGMDAPAIDFTKPVTHAEVMALANKFAFLQMVSSNPNWDEPVIPRFRTAASGWVIHDYGQAMSSSPGRYLFGPGNPEITPKKTADEGGDTSRELAPPENGSYIKQTVDTAEAMIEWAIEKGWPGVEIIAGTQLMQWAAWMAAQERGYSVIGFEPTEKERQKSARIRRLKADRSTPSRPAPTPGSRSDEG